ncbi:protein phosphatase methylesterase 1 isoform, putative [Ixodes scapularis]|uniref:Protein phosphatase methylesterase 1 n=1 Tax=Ixodes scapularis TaxID=6945 RepID=B7P9Y9_IXOSC|nr:protein phosphatase methylesterase 1 isoform, putative [Ixodes scapularis]|eukprot:XP_002405855.1 protein phosphatase methylesterase 1 isoform, putative [Ixodes scapularis]
MSSLQKQVLKNKLPPMRPKPFARVPDRGKCSSRKKDYSPLTWRSYFTDAKDVKTDEGNVFRVYTKGTTGPLLLLLHGGGYSGLTWSLFTSEMCHIVECRVAALDIRGHGETMTTNDNDLSAETLSRDIGAVYSAMYPDDSNQPPVVLVGHSMGGAVAVHAGYTNVIPNLIGLIVIDVVEGYIASKAMHTSFCAGTWHATVLSSDANGISRCSVRSGQVRNLESARVSMPAQLKNSRTGEPATKSIVETAGSRTAAEDAEKRLLNDEAPSVMARVDQIAEEPEVGTAEKVTLQDGSGAFKPPSAARTSDSGKFVWRIDLSRTEEYWRGWFVGLSSLFLMVPCPKLLLLAGVDRLDKDLTIGQMQGKFQMQVLPQCGHAVHEDVPDKASASVAEAVATFLVRNKYAEPTAHFQRTFPAC